MLPGMRRCNVPACMILMMMGCFIFSADWISLMLDTTIPAIPDFSWSHATGARSQAFPALL